MANFHMQEGILNTLKFELLGWIFEVVLNQLHKMV